MSDDPNVNESDAPYITRHCYDTDDWSLPECSKHCCGSPDATCFPTYQGGYCAKDGFYYKYKKRPGSAQKERFAMSRNAFLSETPYQTGVRQEPDWPTTNWYNEARYRDMRRKVIGDLKNESMNTRILREKGRRINPLSSVVIPEIQFSDGFIGLGIILAILLFAICVYSFVMYLKPKVHKHHKKH